MVNEHSANDPQGSDLSSPSTHTDQPDSDQQNEANTSPEAVTSATDSQDTESAEHDASAPEEEGAPNEGTEELADTNPAEVDHGFDEVFAGVVNTSNDKNESDRAELDEPAADEATDEGSEPDDDAPDDITAEDSDEEAIAESTPNEEEVPPDAEEAGDNLNNSGAENIMPDPSENTSDSDDALDSDTDEEESPTQETVDEPETELTTDVDDVDVDIEATGTAQESTASNLDPVETSGEAADVDDAESGITDSETIATAEAEAETTVNEEPEPEVSNEADTNEAEASETETHGAEASETETHEAELSETPFPEVDTETEAASAQDDVSLNDSSDDVMQDDDDIDDDTDVSAAAAEPELDDDWEEEDREMTTDEVSSADSKQPVPEEPANPLPPSPSAAASAPQPSATDRPVATSPKTGPANSAETTSAWAKIQPILTATIGIILTTLIQWLTLGQEALASVGNSAAEDADQGTSGNSIPASIWNVVQPLLVKVLSLGSRTLSAGLGWILSKVDADAYAAVKEGTAPTLPERIQSLPFGDKVWDVLETIWKLWAGLLGFLRDRLFPESIRNWSNQAITAIVATTVAVILWISSALSPSPAQEVATTRSPNPNATPNVERTVPVKKTNSAKDKTLAASIQDRLVEEFTPRYSEDLIQDVAIDRGRDRLTVTIGQEWYDLNERQQQRLAKTILSNTDDTPFSHLKLVNLDGVRIARNPVVGSEMILYQTVPPVIEEPVIEEPVVEEPVAEEPITEESGAEDSGNLETGIIDESDISADVALPDGSPFSQDEIEDGSFAFE